MASYPDLEKKVRSKAVERLEKVIYAEEALQMGKSVKKTELEKTDKTEKINVSSSSCQHNLNSWVARSLEQREINF